eukprot:scaffold3096_cov403-Prasinococcus_capsulatus_cf.AAC.21
MLCSGCARRPGPTLKVELFLVVEASYAVARSLLQISTHSLCLFHRGTRQHGLHLWAQSQLRQCHITEFCCRRHNGAAALREQEFLGLEGRPSSCFDVQGHISKSLRWRPAQGVGLAVETQYEFNLRRRDVHQGVGRAGVRASGPLGTSLSEWCHTDGGSCVRGEGRPPHTYSQRPPAAAPRSALALWKPSNSSRAATARGVPAGRRVMSSRAEDDVDAQGPGSPVGRLTGKGEPMKKPRPETGRARRGHHGALTGPGSCEDSHFPAGRGLSGDGGEALEIAKRGAVSAGEVAAGGGPGEGAGLREGAILCAIECAQRRRGTVR